jgi:hypothetical protein
MDLKETKEGELSHRNVTYPARNEDQRHDGAQIERRGIGPGSRRKTHQATAAKHDPRCILVPSATEIFP